MTTTINKIEMTYISVTIQFNDLFSRVETISSIDNTAILDTIIIKQTEIVYQKVNIIDKINPHRD